ncbi:MAG TPA: septal ring lytic transglycosylase RlpA family protein [Burkholderiales bacterium]|nr:septal ring lytic transglycosylase RlpA family protein [Burkholderiales bacterium]
MTPYRRTNAGTGPNLSTPIGKPESGLRQTFVLASLFALSACGVSPALNTGRYFEDDGPGRNPPPDVASISDAVPKSEPRSKSGNKPYQVFGVNYVPLADASGYRERGVASWYGKKFHGRRTSSGEPYDMYAMTAAHKTLPLPSYVRVRNLENGRSAIVRVNDRGPFLNNRIIDLSYAAAAKLNIIGRGTGVVEIEVVGPNDAVPPPMQVVTAPKAESRPIDATPVVPNVETRAADVALVAPAAELPPAYQVPIATPKLFVQVGSFREWDNAEGLRTRLERAAFRPIAVYSILTETQERVYRVRIGPVSGVEEGDRLTQALTEHGITNPMIVVE